MIYLSKRGQSSYQGFLLADLNGKEKKGSRRRRRWFTCLGSLTDLNGKEKKKQASIEEKDDLPVQTWIYQGSLSADLNGKKNGSRRRRGWFTRRGSRISSRSHLVGRKVGQVSTARTNCCTRWTRKRGTSPSNRDPGSRGWSHPCRRILPLDINLLKRLNNR